ncbi:MAG TPA: polysaccharide deacetylase family protein [Granulicella sp.]
MNAIPITAAAIAAIAAAGSLTYAALSPQSQLFGRVLIAGNNPDQLALTYDDGPNPAATPQLLDLLAAHNVRATFFLIGRFVRTEAALTKRIAAAGHIIGNHTMTHPWLHSQSAARIRIELGDCNAALEDTLGAPVTLFRPPHGARRPAVLRIARELGLTAVNWNILANDWQPALDPAVLLTRVQKGIARNRSACRSSNILLHDGFDQTLGADRLATVEATRRLLALHPAEHFVTPNIWL